MTAPPASAFLFHEGMDGLPATLTGGAVAIGNFDGVHLGHKAVLAAAREEADTGRPALALTFEPHPRSLFQPERPIPRLTPAAEKRLLLARQGLDGMVELNFDGALARLTAENFVARVLVEALRAEAVVVGWDFHFGKDRGGSPAFLQEVGPRHGFKVRVVRAFGEGDPVSSSAIRRLLTAGEVEAANRLLGHRWFVLGKVVQGDQRGRNLGYPTANVVLPAETPLAQGVYAVRIAIDGRVHDGVANFGRRPQFHQDGPLLLETHVFGFAGDLYGKTVAVEFVDYLRAEERFADVAALIAQMDTDSARARDILARPADGAAPSVIG